MKRMSATITTTSAPIWYSATTGAFTAAASSASDPATPGVGRGDWGGGGEREDYGGLTG